MNLLNHHIESDSEVMGIIYRGIINRNVLKSCHHTVVMVDIVKL